jgi:hypothetical protein
VTDAAAWPPDWWAAVAERGASAWRGVEAQHVVATLRLVDTLQEQLVLEQLLEASKPAAPGTGPQHYLLNTPFRYRSPTESRFRRAGAAGIWYGAESLAAAAAEVAYWRWRFITASAGLRNEALVSEHTFFCASVQGQALDLTLPPWVLQRERWTQDRDYSATQALADAARPQGVQWLRYESVRSPGGFCVAVLVPGALQALDAALQQTWHCKATQNHVMLVHGAERHEWPYA